MFNLDPGKMAKNAVEGLQKAEKLGGGAGEAAKGVLQGIKKAEKLADLEKAPEQVIAALRKLLAEAKQLADASGNKNEALDACIQKAQTLLDSDNISTEAVTKLTAELSALIKGASAGAAQQTDSQKGGGSTGASRTAPAPAASAQKAAVPAPKRETQPADAKPAETTASKTVQFSDVDAGAYYYDAVQWAVQQGITSGTSETTFSPDQKCTCGQTISLLWRSAGSPAPKGKNNPFTDVKESAYYYQSALWAAEHGIVTGTAFHPDEPVTRGAVCRVPLPESRISCRCRQKRLYRCSGRRGLRAGCRLGSRAGHRLRNRGPYVQSRRRLHKRADRYIPVPGQEMSLPL